MHELTAGADVADLLAPYLDHDRSPRDGRPTWVLSNMVGGLDGTAAFRGRVDPLSGGSDATLFNLVRSLPDVILVGAGTVRCEGYGPVELDEHRQAQRVARGQSPLPPFAVISGELDFDWESDLFGATEAPTMVVTCASAPARALDRARDHAEVIVAGDEQVDLALTLDALAQRGAATVLCEGGPHVFGEVAALGLLDELLLTVSPVTGGDLLPVGITPAGGHQGDWRLDQVLQDESTLFLRYLRA